MEREPDQTEDPRGTDVGQGYPEEEPSGHSPGEATPEQDVARPRTPETSSAEEGDPGHATGNPHAAGANTDRGAGDQEPERDS